MGLGKSKKRVIVSIAVFALCWYVPPLFYGGLFGLDIQDALCHRLLRGWPNGADVSLSVEDGPASAALLERLKDLKGVILPPQAIATGKDGVFVDPVTRRRTIICSIGGIRWVNPFTVNVVGATADGLMGLVKAVFVLRWSPSGWSVVDHRVTMVT